MRIRPKIHLLELRKLRMSERSGHLTTMYMVIIMLDDDQEGDTKLIAGPSGYAGVYDYTWEVGDDHLASVINRVLGEVGQLAVINRIYAVAGSAAGVQYVLDYVVQNEPALCSDDPNFAREEAKFLSDKYRKDNKQLSTDPDHFKVYTVTTRIEETK